MLTPIFSFPNSFSAQSFGIVPGSTNTLFVYVIQIKTRITLDAMSSFFVSGPGSRCINIHCDGYPRKKIRPYTKGTASWDSVDMVVPLTCGVVEVEGAVVREAT